MSKILIQKITKVEKLKEGTSQKTSKPYTIFEFVCNGTIDGANKEGFIVSVCNSGEGWSDAVQKRVDEFIKPGAAFDAEAKEFRGAITYSTFLPKAAGKGGFGGGGGYNREPAVKYTPEELKALYAWSVMTAGEVLGVDLQGSVETDLLQVVQNGAATLLIAAQKSGMKV